MLRVVRPLKLRGLHYGTAPTVAAIVVGRNTHSPGAFAPSILRFSGTVTKLHSFTVPQCLRHGETVRLCNFLLLY